VHVHLLHDDVVHRQGLGRGPLRPRHRVLRDLIQNPVSPRVVEAKKEMK
jgi:hypothetical protein